MRRVLPVALVGLVLAALVVGGVLAYRVASREPLPWENACLATIADRRVRITPEQAENASIIAAVAVGRGLPPRAASVALTTAWQESGLRNLDHGDRDSLGLFQQRPSQGWGTPAQVQDPVYAAGRFYAALVKEKGWQTADIGDVAQEIQRSGFPDAYDKHVERARVLASSLTGETAASFTCSLTSAGPADADGFVALLHRVLPGVRVQRQGGSLVVTGDGPASWTVATLAVAQARRYGVREVATMELTWTRSWTGAHWLRGGSVPAGRVEIAFG